MLRRRAALWSRRRPRGSDDGAVAVLVAIVVVGVVMPLMAIVVDLGIRRLFADQSRGAADAAALAAAGTAKATNGDFSRADSDARALVEANLPTPNGGWGPAWASCADPAHLPTVAGSGTCISFDPMLKRVRVTVPERNVPTVFSGTVGISSISASATTTATWGLDPSPTCALCVFGNYTGGRKVVQVAGDDVAVGGNLTVSGSGNLTVSGGGQVRFGGSRFGSGIVFPTAVRDTRPVGDPYAATLDALSRTTPNGQPVYGQQSQTVPPNGSCDPGIYQDITNCTTITGNGTYFVTGRPGANVNVSLNDDASQVVLFFTCSAGGFGQPVVAAHCSPLSSMPRLVGTNRTITASTASDIAVVFDDRLTRSQRLSSSSGGLTINGGVYGPDATLGAAGGSTSMATVNGHVVVAGVSFSTFGSSGTTVLQVTVLPPTPQPVLDGPVRLAAGS